MGLRDTQPTSAPTLSHVTCQSVPLFGVTRPRDEDRSTPGKRAQEPPLGDAGTAVRSLKSPIKLPAVSADADFATINLYLPLNVSRSVEKPKLRVSNITVEYEILLL